MKDGTETKVKFASLQTALDLTLFEIRGLLDTLWFVTKNNAPCGDIGRFTNEWIAKMIGWRYDPDVLVNALVDNGWLDPHDIFRLVVHDWAEHCEDSVHRKLARSRQWFCDGRVPVLTRLAKAEKAQIEEFYSTNSAQLVARNVRTSSAHGTCAPEVRMKSAPQPSLALPEPSLAKPLVVTQPSAPSGADEPLEEPQSGGERLQEEPPEAVRIVEDFKSEEPEPKRITAASVSADFEEFYALYPRKKDRAQAEKSYLKVRKEGVTHQRIMDGLRRELPELKAAMGIKTAQGRTPCKYPATWLSAGSFDNVPDSKSDRLSREECVDDHGNPSIALLKINGWINGLS